MDRYSKVLPSMTRIWSLNKNGINIYSVQFGAQKIETLIFGYLTWTMKYNWINTPLMKSNIFPKKLDEWTMFVNYT